MALFAPMSSVAVIIPVALLLLLPELISGASFVELLDRTPMFNFTSGDRMPMASLNSNTTNGERPCAWGQQRYESGAYVDVPSYWFMCHDGEFLVQGCYSDTGVRVAFGKTFQTENGYEMLCEMRDNGTYGIVPTACVNNGMRILSGDTFQDEYFWYTCRLNGDSITKEVSGCVDRSGKRVVPGDLVRIGSYLYQCTLNAQSELSLKPQACVFKDKRYEIGQKIINGLFWYTCKNSGPLIMSELGGCVHGNMTMKVGDKYYQNGFAIKCVSLSASRLAHVVVSCLQVGDNGEVLKEMQFGERWRFGSPPFLFTVECQQTGESSATTTTVDCVYQTPGGPEFPITAGCFRQVNPNMVVMCYRRPDGVLGIDRTTPQRLDRALDMGLQQC